LWYAEHLEKSGIWSSSTNDIRNGKTADYGLNINDNTPLLILATLASLQRDEQIGHSSSASIRPAVKAANYILSQRNGARLGVVHCQGRLPTGGSSDGATSIPNYRLSGADDRGKLRMLRGLAHRIAHGARAGDAHEESAAFMDEADALRSAIKRATCSTLTTGLYYLNIELDGRPRTDITSDLVFPVMFGVCDDQTAARIIKPLERGRVLDGRGDSHRAPQCAETTDRPHGYGLLRRRVWVGVAFLVPAVRGRAIQIPSSWPTRWPRGSRQLLEGPAGRHNHRPRPVLRNGCTARRWSIRG